MASILAMSTIAMLSGMIPPATSQLECTAHGDGGVTCCTRGIDCPGVVSPADTITWIIVNSTGEPTNSTVTMDSETLTSLIREQNKTQTAMK
jgi:hypothetical protein